ncbi:MAG: pyruvate kinase [Bacteroidota bacterium]|jgi:pyruvate kinase
MKDRKTKIIATIGPSCNTYERILELVQEGVNVFRLNFSHGLHAEKKEVIDIIQSINEKYPFNIAILADLQGPKLRVGEIENNALPLQEGDFITFTNTKCIGTKQAVYVSYPNLANDVRVGEKILIDDGKIEVVITDIHPNGDVTAQVLIAGVLSSKKGINLPDTNVSLPSLTEKDLEDVDFIIGQPIDWVALSFVRKPEDVTHLREVLHSRGSNAKIIAKVEKPEAVKNIREVILASDAIMIARGDLGVEMPVEQIPMIQKNIIRKCIHRAKPVIVATQMMESMIDRSKPNRSEISDVANAVLEGADAVMLSGETAVGHHPALVVNTMSRIIVEVEKEERIYHKNLVPQKHSPSFLSDAVIWNACEMSENVDAKALIGMTQSGYTGFMLSSYRPKSSIYVFTKTQTLINQLSLSWGVHAFYYYKETTLDEQIADQIAILKEKGLVETDDVVVSALSTPIIEHLPTNTIKISTVK